jgi:TonB family protein
MTFHPAHDGHFASATDRRQHLTAALLVLAIHALLVPLLLFGLASKAVSTDFPKMVMAALPHSIAHKPPDAPPAPHRPRLAPVTAAAPDIVIETQTPTPPAPGPAIAMVPVSAMAMSYSGGGAGAGAGAKAGGSGAGAGRGSNYDDTDYLRRVAIHIQNHMLFPARLLRSFGRREMSFLILLHLIFRPDGSVQLVEVSKSSGWQVVDDAALAAVHRSDPLPPFPLEEKLNHIEVLRFPIVFTINAGMH